MGQRFDSDLQNQSEEEGWPGDNEEFAVCSIVAFRVVREGRPLDAAGAGELYRRLAAERSVLLGQPVALRDGSAALRLSCDARWIVRLAHSAQPEAELRSALAWTDFIT